MKSFYKAPTMPRIHPVDVEEAAATVPVHDFEFDNSLTEKHGNTEGGESKTDSPSSKRKKKKGGFRKCPQAPRRFKSPYILFSISKMAEYKNSMKNVQVTSISRRIAEEWKIISGDERKKWDQIALQDKMRYNAEKQLYTGPWQVPSKRTRKDPSAPKRPPSAFLFYCQTKRKQLKDENPEMKNTEISKLLGQLWKTEPMEVRQPHIEREQRERDNYKEKIAEWRQQRQKEESLARQRRQEVAEQYIRSGSGVAPTVSTQFSNGIAPAQWGGTGTMPTPSPVSVKRPASKISVAASLADMNSPPTIVESRSDRASSTAESQQHFGQEPDAKPFAASVESHGHPFREFGNTSLGTQIDKGFPGMPFSYSDGEIVESAQSSGTDPQLFPPFFHGDTNFDPPFPLMDPPP